MTVGISQECPLCRRQVWQHAGAEPMAPGGHRRGHDAGLRRGARQCMSLREREVCRQVGYEVMLFSVKRAVQEWRAKFRAFLRGKHYTPEL